MSTLYRNANVYRTATGEFQRLDLRIEHHRIQRLSPHLTPLPEERVVDLLGKALFPGFVDVHVHLREPGAAYKETIASGTAAAAHGGYTTICAMPNLNPTPDNMEHLAVEQQLIDTHASIEVLPYATITQCRTAGNLVDFSTLAPHVVGFSNDGNGVQDTATMLHAMQRCAPTGRPIVAHCEVDHLLEGGYIHAGEYAAAHHHRGISSATEWLQVARDIGLVRQTGCPYHVCHVSTLESVQLLREAQREGLPITAETAPHYLLLTEQDLKEEGCYKMNPPLRSSCDREALREALRDGTISCIATDHAPHSEAEKSGGLRDSAMGIVGIETAFPLLYHHLVLKGHLSLQTLIKSLTDHPRQIFHIEGGIEEGMRADFSVWDLDTVYHVDPEKFLSKGHSTPFHRWTVQGKPLLTVANGKEVYQNL